MPTAACRLSAQDANAFLRDMPVVGQDVREALAAHAFKGVFAQLPKKVYSGG